MKTAEEILEPYVETPFRHTKVVEKDNAILAMNKFGNQFKGMPKLKIEEHTNELGEDYYIVELIGVEGMVVEGKTKDKAIDEMMVSIRVKLLSDLIMH